VLNIRPVEPSDAEEWLRLRMALWPDSLPAEEAALGYQEVERYFRKELH
jgi:hypothetical protein